MHKAPEAEKVAFDYGIPCAECYKKNGENWNGFEKCLVKEFKIGEGEAARLKVLYREAIAKGLKEAMEKGILQKKSKRHALPRNIYYYHQPVGYSYHPYYPLGYHMQQYPAPALWNL